MSTRRGSQHWSTASIGNESSGSDVGGSIDSDFWDRKPGDWDWGADEETKTGDKQTSNNNNDLQSEPKTDPPVDDQKTNTTEQKHGTDPKEEQRKVQMRPEIKFENRRQSLPKQTFDVKKDDERDVDQTKPNSPKVLSDEHKEPEKSDDSPKEPKTAEVTKEECESPKEPMENYKDKHQPLQYYETKPELPRNPQAAQPEKVAIQDLQKSDSEKNPDVDHSVKQADDKIEQNNVKPAGIDIPEDTKKSTNPTVDQDSHVSSETSKASPPDASIKTPHPPHNTQGDQHNRTVSPASDIKTEGTPDPGDSKTMDNESSPAKPGLNKGSEINEQSSLESATINKSDNTVSLPEKEAVKENKTTDHGSVDNTGDTVNGKTDEISNQSTEKETTENDTETSDSQSNDKKSKIKKKRRTLRSRRPSSGSLQNKTRTVPNQAKPPIPKPRTSRRTSKDKRDLEQTESKNDDGKDGKGNGSPKPSIKPPSRRSSMELYGPKGRQSPKKRVKFEDEIETAVQGDDKTQQWVEDHFQGPLIDVTDETTEVNTEYASYTDPQLSSVEPESSPEQTETVKRLDENNRVEGHNTANEKQEGLTSRAKNGIDTSRTETEVPVGEGYITSTAHEGGLYDIRGRRQSPLIYYVGKTPWWDTGRPFSPLKRRPRVVETPVTAKPPTPPPKSPVPPPPPPLPLLLY